MLQIRLLGGMEACQDDRPLPEFGPQLRRLLAFLTLEAGRPVENGRIWQELWADNETADCVRTNLARLRKSLGSEAERIVVKGSAVSLNLSGADVDTISTEANLFIKNLNQSPFNVGTRVTLRDFNPEQVGELNARYGSPLSPPELARLYQLVGGHPYLARRALCALAQKQTSLDRIEDGAEEEDSLFHDHLERLRFALLLDTELTHAVTQWLHEGAEPTHAQFARLCAAGVMAGRSPAEMRPRCPLYARYLRKTLP